MVNIKKQLDRYHHWDVRNSLKKIRPSQHVSIWKYIMISSANFWIFPLAFAKNGLFFDLNRFFLENGPLYGSKTLIFGNYNQFATKWYIICLYSMKIEASRFFSQKSSNCPMGRSSLFEPCLNFLFFLWVHSFIACFSIFGGDRPTCYRKQML